jgi:hypothetical protein
MDKEIAKLQKELAALEKLAKVKKPIRGITVKKCGEPLATRPGNFRVVRLSNFLDIEIGAYLSKAQLQGLIDAGVNVNVAPNT